jgi:hypothetical protein
MRLPKPIRQAWDFSAHLGHAIWLWSAGGGALMGALTWIANQPLWLVLWVAVGTFAVLLVVGQRIQAVFRGRADARLRQRALGLADTLRGRLRLAESARDGSRAHQRKWKEKAASQLLFRTDRFESAGDAGVSDRLVLHFEKAVALFSELERIASLTTDGKGYVTLAQAAGRYVICGNKLYAELAAIAGINPDWKADD